MHRYHVVSAETLQKVKHPSMREPDYINNENRGTNTDFNPRPAYLNHLSESPMHVRPIVRST